MKINSNLYNNISIQNNDAELNTSNVRFQEYRHNLTNITRESYNNYLKTCEHSNKPISIKYVTSKYELQIEKIYILTKFPISNIVQIDSLLGYEMLSKLKSVNYADSKLDYVKFKILVAANGGEEFIIDCVAKNFLYKEIKK